MGIDASQLRKYVIRPTLQFLGLHSLEAEGLLLLTAAVESDMGAYLHQVGGPALGIYQIEPATKNAVERFARLSLPPQLYGKLKLLRTEQEFPGTDDLIWNLAYATAICRLKYYMAPASIPFELTGWAKYWKQWYNTPQGKGTVDEAIKSYIKYVGRGI